MSAALLAGMTGLFVFAAAWELVGLDVPIARRRAPARRAGRVIGAGRAGERWARKLDIAGRLERAGLAGRVTPRVFLATKVAGAGLGAVATLAILPVAPGRLLPILGPGLVAAGFLAPDAWAERESRRRRAAMTRALPDALELLAVGASAGRPPSSLLAEIAAAGAKPLAEELAVALTEIETGVTQERALARMRARTGAAELGAFFAALERSRRFGSPLAAQLHAQAAALRREERRRIAERAARAAPKIQLVIALVLVPSALLMIAAAIIAHSDVLFSAI